jgi:hypothetical protein
MAKKSKKAGKATAGAAQVRCDINYDNVSIDVR